MGRQATGTTYTSADGTLIARLTIAGGYRLSVPLWRNAADPYVKPALRVMNAYARKLQQAARLSPQQIQAGFTEASRRMRDMRPPVAGPDYVQRWEDIAHDDVITALVGVALVTEGLTFERLAKQWTSGKLHAEHGDAVPVVKSAKRDESMFRLYAYPVIGIVPIQDLRVTHLNLVVARMRAAKRRDQTILYVWKMICRVLSIARYPLEVITGHPIPRQARPKIRDVRRTPAFHPEDYRLLMTCREVPIQDRILCGFLARVGLRLGEALALKWSDLSSDGILSLYRTKTTSANDLALDADVVSALRMYRTCFAPDAKPTDLIFGRKRYFSRSFRRSLAKAGVFNLHPELAIHGKSEGDRRQIRIHDLRRFFVTLAVAQGRGDGYIRSHTGHTGAVMIAHYTDAAGVLVARGTVTLVPLHEAIPELLELVNRLESSTANAAE